MTPFELGFGLITLLGCALGLFLIAFAVGAFISAGGSGRDQ